MRLLIEIIVSFSDSSIDISFTDFKLLIDRNNWFTSKSVERTKAVLNNPFAVYDLTFLEWEQKETISQSQKVYLCKDQKKGSKPFFEVVYKKERLLIFSVFRHEDQSEARKVFDSTKDMLNVLTEGITSSKPQVVAPIVNTIISSRLSHPKWTAAHIAAKVGLDQLFAKKSPKVINDLNAQTKPDLSSPLHLAIESGSAVTTKAVLALKPKLDLKDESHNCAIHLAAMSDKDILQELLKEPTALDMLKWTNRKGCTPLHLACYSLKYENVIRLLEFGLTVRMLTVSKPHKRVKLNDNSDKVIRFRAEDIEDLDTEDIQYGGTPLHWVKHRRALERFIAFGFDLNVRNGLGETALHTMVKRMRLKCQIGLLCFGAKVNRCDDSGQSPLHLAVRGADVTSTQALIIFDATIDAKNRQKESARHMASKLEHPDHHMVLHLLTAIGAKRCTKEMDNCRPGCAHDGDYEGTPYHRWPNNDNENFYKKVLLEYVVREAIRQKNQNLTNESKGMRMLCLDGGGVRGLITVQVMLEIERRLGTSLCSVFDWIAGTSTGSILAMLMSIGRPLKEMRAIYFRLKDKILVGSRPYSTRNLETLLEEEIGSDLKMCDIKDRYSKFLVIFALLIDRNPAKLHVFRSFESSDEVLGLPELHQSATKGFKVYPNHKEQVAWKACRASGAAPTYFRASGAFLDGGLAANNPTLDAITEFRLYNNALKSVGREEEAHDLGLVVSIGTGKFPVTPTEPIDVHQLWSFNPRELNKNILYLKQMGNLLINQACATEGHIIDRAQSWCSCIKTPYFRINPQLSEVIALDETSDVEICNALWETKAYMYALREEVDLLIALLLPGQVTNIDMDRDSAKTGLSIRIANNDIDIESKGLPQREESIKDCDKSERQ